MKSLKNMKVSHLNKINTKKEVKSYSKILLLGSGPIVIGQACEFDYSGTQACKALKSRGYEVILVNSNPATIMTDPDLADKVYIEPLNVESLSVILEKERPDAVIPTLGGQTALNLALDLNAAGLLEKYNVDLLGATPEVILAAEDREKFNEILDLVGAKKAKSVLVREFKKGLQEIKNFDFPVILRPNFTLGGGGGGVAYSLEEYEIKLANALKVSPTSEVLVEQSLLGWKEFELELMRDRNGTCVVICSIENIDPCGVHTGDSITVAPQQTLSDREYQDMRDESFKILEAVGVETGGANIQFAVHPTTGERIVIEMNPRVSRSSALASKATGFPIAKIAALVAVGESLDSIQNDITQVTPSCYEPALDYVVVKIPRFAFEKFPGADTVLTTQMKSVGEVMSLGRTFQEALGKAILSMEDEERGWKPVSYDEEKMAYPNSERIHHVFAAFQKGVSLEEVHRLTQISPWFLEQIESMALWTVESKNKQISTALILEAKRKGFSDALLADVFEKETKESLLSFREKNKIEPGFLPVDTCAGEFEAKTPYFYSTYWSEDRSELEAALLQLDATKIVALFGSGPNRIGQGIEFDYTCVRSVKSFQKLGFPVAMVNSNPETVSTDYDTADLLFFEPLHFEFASEVLKAINAHCFVAQVGGQTPLSLAPYLVQRGFQLLGSSLETFDLAEDRGQFSKLCLDLDLKVPESSVVSGYSEAQVFSEKVGFPLMCRPSYVLGGRRMEILETAAELEDYFQRHGEFISENSPCYVDQFLENALEIDVDVVAGGSWAFVGGIIEHIEAAGIHSGDSMGVMPTQRLKPETKESVIELSLKLAKKLNVKGFLNIQLALKDDEIYVIEANPRSSRTVPFISKASRVPIVDGAVAGMLDFDKPSNLVGDYAKEPDVVCVKGVNFPFHKFPQADTLLGPEMKSTGESMGRGQSFAEALSKALYSSGVVFPEGGEVFLSLRDKDKPYLVHLVQKIVDLGFALSATGGTYDWLLKNNFEGLSVKKVHEGRPHCVDRIRSGQIAFVINTVSGKKSIEASQSIRRSCLDYGIPCLTEKGAAEAFVLALSLDKKKRFEGVYPL